MALDAFGMVNSPHAVEGHVPAVMGEVESRFKPSALNAESCLSRNPARSMIGFGEGLKDPCGISVQKIQANTASTKR